MPSSEEAKSTQRFSWKKANSLLTETEKNRICCLLLTCFEQIRPTGEDFELAAAQFGAAKGGFCKMYQTTIKKLKDANAFIVEGENVDDVPTPPSGQQAPRTPKKKATRRKNVAGEDGDEAEGTPTSSKKPRVHKSKEGTKTKVANDNADSELLQDEEAEA
ncbi:uncharacterized protein PV09_04291 [Verruconis gallopava]|uniref:Uncharacterized protein n=1 Tax=Verruconis gallopava TaxID=253628 RepID=A0A0D1YV72_9PEZI|nr:uncharacterized protein PV09_04291 [Verruconis gallopava]KIW04537.1 hypothetical protein PV09_04291 [Verruconis gallopava]